MKYHTQVPLAMAQSELTLKVRKPDEPMQKYFAEVLARPEDAAPFHRYVRMGWLADDWGGDVSDRSGSFGEPVGS